MTQLQELTTLAGRINEEHERCRAAFTSAMQHAIRAGELLIEAKAQVDHGQWQRWVNDNCEFAVRTAQAYMRVARNRDELEAKTQHVAHLPLRGALAMLSDSKEQELDLPDLDAMLAYAAEFDEWWEENRDTLQVLKLALDNAETPEQCIAIAKTARRISNEAAEYRLRMEWNAGKALKWLGSIFGDDNALELVNDPELLQEVLQELEEKQQEPA